MRLFSLCLLIISKTWCFSQTDTLNYCSGPVVDFAHTEPDFPGGMGKLSEFISQQLTYPTDANPKKEMGTVYVMFTVNVDGSLCDVTIVKSVSAALDKEALRIISLMPKWIPAATDKGQPARCRFQVPIKIYPN